MASNPLLPVLVLELLFLAAAGGLWIWARRRRGEVSEVRRDVLARRQEADAAFAPSAAPEPVSSPARSIQAATSPQGAPLPGWLQAVLTEALSARYEAFRLLDQGARGALVQAWDRQLERHVAVKVPPPHFSADPAFHDRFLREARALAAFDHPGLVTVYDVPEVPEGETPVMVVETVGGRTLASHLAEQGAASPREVAAWARQLAPALDYVHAQGVVHRNLCPATLMVDETGALRLSDFGLAAVQDASRLTGTELSFGDPAYQPPAQLAGAPADAASDRYALAALLFEALTGAQPFARSDMARDQAPAATARRGELPAEVDEVFRKALAPTPQAGYPDAGSFAEALTQALRGA